MNRREFFETTALGLTALSLSSRSTYAAQISEVVIGVLYPLSGPSAQIGLEARFAFETAVDIINNIHEIDLPLARTVGLPQLGGAKIRLIFVDHQGDPQKGRAEAERLITQEKVCGLIGAFHSSVSATASSVAERYGVPYIAADSSSPSLHRRGFKFFFRPGPHDEMFSMIMFDFFNYLKSKGKKIETIGLFFEDTIFGTDSANIQRQLAKEKGYRVVVDLKYRSNSPSLTSEVQQLKNANPDVLLPSSYTADAILLMKTMAELGYKPTSIIAQAAGFSDKTFYEAVGDQGEGIISRSSFALDLGERRPFIFTVNNLYKTRSGKDLNDNTSRQFTALFVLAEAINRAQSIEGEKIREALVETDIPGNQTIMPWRRVKFDTDGQNGFVDPILLQYKKGNFVTIFPSSLASAEEDWPMKNDKIEAL